MVLQIKGMDEGGRRNRETEGGAGGGGTCREVTIGKDEI